MTNKTEVKPSYTPEQCKDCHQGYTIGEVVAAAYPDHIKLCPLHASTAQLVEALKNVAGMLPVASRLHPGDLIKLQTQVVAALKAAGVEI